MQPEDAPREYGITPPGYRLPARTRLGKVRLLVSDLAASVAYYRDLLGLRVVQQDAVTARLGADEGNDSLIELRHEPGVSPVSRAGTLGLYHFAILVPSRAMLGRFVKHLVSANVQFGAADHLVSEAIYLWDPDGLGVEVYADRPRETWQTNEGELVMATERLDLTSIIDAAGPDGWSSMPAGTTMGHLHLSVDNLDVARSFYHRGLGLDATVWHYPGALFMSAGGYHHHLGTNTWAMGARVPGSSDARLLEWELVLPSRADVEAALASMRASGFETLSNQVTDPWGTALRLTAAA